MSPRAPTVSLLFRQFVDDEFLRAPMAMEMALQDAIEVFQRSPSLSSPSERQMAGELMLRLAGYRSRVVDRYVASLREQVGDELAGRRPTAFGATAGTELSLVEDEDVSIDVVISHVIEIIKSTAEHELREMLAYTSALVGDMDVGADHNPFRADTQARALWAAAQTLPQSRGHQIAFMRYAALPFAQSLRKSYVATCTRLQNQGVVPAAYRTVIPPAGPRVTRGASSPILSRANDLFETVTVSVAPSWSATQGVQSAQIAATQGQIFERVGRLFGAVMTDRQLHVELHPCISRMQSLVLQWAARDADLLVAPQHAMWRFMDSFAQLATVYPGPDGAERAQTLRFVALLLDQLGEEAQHTETLYEWAIERVQRYAANRLTARCTAAEPQIKTMQTLEHRLARTDAPISTLHGALDVAQLDTVPAALLDSADPDGQRSPMACADWFEQLRPGQWLCLFRKGGWVYSQLLWLGDRGELFLFGDGDGAPGQAWAIRRSALARLHEERLAQESQTRSLLLDALDTLKRRAQRGQT